MKLRLLSFSVLLLGVYVLSSSSILAGQKTNQFKEAQQRYLHTAEEYRNRARDLQVKAGSVSLGAQTYVRQLVKVYGQLADTKVRLADAIGRQDWTTEERLETRYYKLKAQEKKLWGSLEETKQ